MFDKFWIRSETWEQNIPRFCFPPRILTLTLTVTITNYTQQSKISTPSLVVTSILSTLFYSFLSLPSLQKKKKVATFISWLPLHQRAPQLLSNSDWPSMHPNSPSPLSTLGGSSATTTTTPTLTLVLFFALSAPPSKTPAGPNWSGRILSPTGSRAGPMNSPMMTTHTRRRNLTEVSSAVREIPGINLIKSFFIISFLFCLKLAKEKKIYELTWRIIPIVESIALIESFFLFWNFNNLSFLFEFNKVCTRMINHIS